MCVCGGGGCWGWRRLIAELKGFPAEKKCRSVDMANPDL